MVALVIPFPPLLVSLLVMSLCASPESPLIPSQFLCSLKDALNDWLENPPGRGFETLYFSLMEQLLMDY